MARKHDRVLLLGPTGVDKATAIARVKQQLEIIGHQARYVDFENDFLKARLSVKSWTTFLAQDLVTQATTWGLAWGDFIRTLDHEITILGLHATYISAPIGLRSPINIPKICEEFKPTMIVSLIDDVFQMWCRTEDRAEGRDFKGRPGFEQLLVARRAELLLGDVILSHLGDPNARHVLCATGNDIEVLVNLIIFDAGVTYLSFPISAAREMEARGDIRFVELINEAHHLAAKEMRTARDRAFITPLAIDELPIVEKFRKASSEADKIEFDSAHERWSLDSLWGVAGTPILPSVSGARTFPVSQIEDAKGAIKMDVGWRDRRLVLQSKSLAIICPKPPDEDRITRGVNTEIETAVPMGIVCNIWQKSDWDQAELVQSRYQNPGSMGVGQTESLTQIFPTLEQLIRAKP